MQPGMSDHEPAPTPKDSDYAPTAMPSRMARAVAFAAIVIAGLCGAVIGYALVDLQCEGACTLQKGLATLGGGLVGAVGVAVVATLGLRAMGEWREIEHRNTTETNGSRPV
jgi:hypothetical protein